MEPNVSRRFALPAAFAAPLGVIAVLAILLAFLSLARSEVSAAGAAASLIDSKRPSELENPERARSLEYVPTQRAQDSDDEADDESGDQEPDPTVRVHVVFDMSATLNGKPLPTGFWPTREDKWYSGLQIDSALVTLITPGKALDDYLAHLAANRIDPTLARPRSAPALVIPDDSPYPQDFDLGERIPKSRKLTDAEKDWLRVAQAPKAQALGFSIDPGVDHAAQSVRVREELVDNRLRASNVEWASKNFSPKLPLAAQRLVGWWLTLQHTELQTRIAIRLAPTEARLEETGWHFHFRPVTVELEIAGTPHCYLVHGRLTSADGAKAVYPTDDAYLHSDVKRGPVSAGGKKAYEEWREYPPYEYGARVTPNRNGSFHLWMMKNRWTDPFIDALLAPANKGHRVYVHASTKQPVEVGLPATKPDRRWLSFGDVRYRHALAVLEVDWAAGAWDASPFKEFRGVCVEMSEAEATGPDSAFSAEVTFDWGAAPICLPIPPGVKKLDTQGFPFPSRHLRLWLLQAPRVDFSTSTGVPASPHLIVAPTWIGSRTLTVSTGKEEHWPPQARVFPVTADHPADADRIPIEEAKAFFDTYSGFSRNYRGVTILEPMSHVLPRYPVGARIRGFWIGAEGGDMQTKVLYVPAHEENHVEIELDEPFHRLDVTLTWDTFDADALLEAAGLLNHRSSACSAAITLRILRPADRAEFCSKKRDVGSTAPLKVGFVVDKAEPMILQVIADSGHFASGLGWVWDRSVLSEVSVPAVSEYSTAVTMPTIPAPLGVVHWDAWEPIEGLLWHWTGFVRGAQVDDSDRWPLAELDGTMCNGVAWRVAGTPVAASIQPCDASGKGVKTAPVTHIRNGKRVVAVSSRFSGRQIVELPASIEVEINGKGIARERFAISLTAVGTDLGTHAAYGERGKTWTAETLRLWAPDGKAELRVWDPSSREPPLVSRIVEVGDQVLKLSITLPAKASESD